MVVVSVSDGSRDVAVVEFSGERRLPRPDGSVLVLDRGERARFKVRSGRVPRDVAREIWQQLRRWPLAVGDAGPFRFYVEDVN